MTLAHKSVNVDKNNMKNESKKDMGKIVNAQEVETIEEKKFSFDKSFQEKIIIAMIYDRVWASQFSEVLNVNYFEYAHLKKLSSIYVNYHNKYKEFPTLELLAQIVAEDLKNLNDSNLKEQIKFFLKYVAEFKDFGDLAYVKEKSLDFCKRAGLQKALEESVDLINTERYEKIVEIVKTAINAGTEHTSGLTLTEDVDARYSETYRRTVPTGIEQLDQRSILNGGLGGGEIGVVVAPSGCHKKGTKILMYDGILKNVEDIIPGEAIMGPDSKPRIVQSLARGKEKMYDIVPIKGEAFTVNENHILSLRNCTTDKIVNVSVKEYLNTSKNFKNTHKLYRANAISFQANEKVLPIDPYMLGVMLGDGWINEKRVEITTADIEIVNEIYNFAKNENLDIAKHYKKGTKASGYYFTVKGKHNNPLRNKLRDINLLNTTSGTKFIPQAYKTSSINSRLELLAGLLDTDGYFLHNTYSFISKSKNLAEDVAYIARSLGFAAYITQKTKSNQDGVHGPYYDVSISGNVNKISCRLPRKKATSRKQIKNVLNTGFSVKESVEDDYYGFTVDRDHLYVMGDFTVTHNCGKSHLLTHFGAAALLRGKNVVHYTFELNERAIGIRYDSHLLGVNSTDCYMHKDEIKKFYNDNADTLGRLIIKYFPTGSATVNTLRAHIEKLSHSGFRPDVLVVDYAGIMRSTEKYELLRLELKKIFEELRGFAAELDIPVWTAAQSNKEGMNSDFVDMSNMAEAYAQAHIADFIVGLSRKSANKATGYGNIFIAKNRAGMDGIKFEVHLDTAQSRLRILSDDEVMKMKSGNASEEDEIKNILRMKLRNFQKTSPIKIEDQVEISLAVTEDQKH